MNSNAEARMAAFIAIATLCLAAIDLLSLETMTLLHALVLTNAVLLAGVCAYVSRFVPALRHGAMVMGLGALAMAGSASALETTSGLVSAALGLVLVAIGLWQVVTAMRVRPQNPRI